MRKGTDLELRYINVEVFDHGWSPWVDDREFFSILYTMRPMHFEWLEFTSHLLITSLGRKKIASPGGLEPPTFRLTAERANRLRHGDWCTEMKQINNEKIIKITGRLLYIMLLLPH